MKRPKILYRSHLFHPQKSLQDSLQKACLGRQQTIWQRVVNVINRLWKSWYLSDCLVEQTQFFKSDKVTKWHFWLWRMWTRCGLDVDSISLNHDFDIIVYRRFWPCNTVLAISQYLSNRGEMHQHLPADYAHHTRHLAGRQYLSCQGQGFKMSLCHFVTLSLCHFYYFAIPKKFQR